MSRDPRSHQAEDSRSLACTAVRAPWGPGSPLHTHAWVRDKPSPASGFGVLSPGLYSFLSTPQPPELPGRARGPWTRWTETHLRTRDGKADPPPTASAPPTAHVTHNPEAAHPGLEVGVPAPPRLCPSSQQPPRPPCAVTRLWARASRGLFPQSSTRQSHFDECRCRSPRLCGDPATFGVRGGGGAGVRRLNQDLINILIVAAAPLAPGPGHTRARALTHTLTHARPQSGGKD